MSLSLAQGFDWLARPDAQVLILGSIPGIASLQQQQYYAHPRNAFWPIMQQIYDWPHLDYARRCQALINEKIALWDVLHSCRRRGSLDSDIDSNSLAINNFPALLSRHPDISRILFNGAKAAQLFQRHVNIPDAIQLVKLPSTSPAHAAMSFQVKLEKWRMALISE
ncbi:MAG: DNA-deoxyinosine glycosylase [Methylophaga sp.]|nr:DNA-deoxyinosine glycosylase [Methylophaga sp.]